MTKLMLVFFAWLLVLGGLGVWGCRKEEKPTILEGRVVDAKTGIGLPMAQIAFSVRPLGSNDNAGTSTGTFTDANGNYRIEIGPNLLIGNFIVLKTGYFGKVFLDNPAKRGEVTQIDIALQPADSALKLIVKNENAVYDSLFVKLLNPSIDFPGISQPSSPLVLQDGEEQSEYFLCPSNSWTKIIWAHSKSSFLLSPFIDSVYHTAQDTSEFMLSY